jgi:polysaccharide deacetylase family protein (PEP-CTERM system associated)
MKVINALSFDVEDWYHGFIATYDRAEEWESYESRVVSDTMLAMSILKKYNVKSTFFVLGYVASRFPDLICRIFKEGHEIATHGYLHRRVYNQNPAQFEADLRSSIETLEKITSEKVLGYRAPDFSVTSMSLWALDIMAKNGLAYDSSIFPTKNYIYGIPCSPRFPYSIMTESNREIIEFPLSTIRFFNKNMPIAGGIYLRALPFFIIRNGLRALNKEGKPAVVYLHPWELNPECPKLEGSILHRMIYKYNLSTTVRKLETLLKNFTFCPMRDILKEVRQNARRYQSKTVFQ